MTGLYQSKLPPPSPKGDYDNHVRRFRAWKAFRPSMQIDRELRPENDCRFWGHLGEQHTFALIQGEHSKRIKWFREWEWINPVWAAGFLSKDNTHD